MERSSSLRTPPPRLHKASSEGYLETTPLLQPPRLLPSQICSSSSSTTIPPPPPLRTIQQRPDCCVIISGGVEDNGKTSSDHNSEVAAGTEQSTGHLLEEEPTYQAVAVALADVVKVETLASPTLVNVYDHPSLLLPVQQNGTPICTDQIRIPMLAPSPNTLLNGGRSTINQLEEGGARTPLAGRKDIQNGRSATYQVGVGRGRREASLSIATRGDITSSGLVMAAAATKLATESSHLCASTGILTSFNKALDKIMDTRLVLIVGWVVTELSCWSLFRFFWVGLSRGYMLSSVDIRCSIIWHL